MNLARSAGRHLFLIKTGLLLFCLGPAGNLLTEYFQQTLGVNPLNRLLHHTGWWAIYMLLATLAITPARQILAYLSIKCRAQFGKRLSDWNWIIRLRRLLGLVAFFYACLHVGVYVGFDVGLNWQWFVDDLTQRPFILMGLVSFVLLVPLAFTSSDLIMRRMGRNWRRLHRLIYLIGATSLIHVWWMLKVGADIPVVTTLSLTTLLSFRVATWLGWRLVDAKDGGMEIAQRHRKELPGSTKSERAPADVKAQSSVGR